MPGTALHPQKRVLGDSTKAHRNATVLPSPSAAKRRRLDLGSSPASGFKGLKGQRGPPGSSQTKSHFEEEVLEKLTQEINELKQNNSEKDQQWDRPALKDFDEKRTSLCFQQIEAEKGAVQGGKAAVKLFGVTEVRRR